MPVLELTEQQQDAVDLAGDHHLFITGAGGVGKSFVIAEILRKFPGTILTSSTWVSAGNIGGISFNSAGGLGLGNETPQRMVSKMGQRVKARLQKAKMMLIDEISMVHPILLDKFDQVLKMIRECDEPFGGLMIIMAGDFFQLPAVNDDKRDRQVHYAFESNVWREASPNCIELTKIMRQTDEEFQRILNAIRTGEMEGVDFDPLYDRMVDSVSQRSGEFTVLNTHRRDVADYNLKKLRDVDGELFESHADDFGVPAMTKNSRLPQHLQLKRGALAICLASVGGLRNGSVVTVQDFHEDGIEVKSLKHGTEHLITRTSQKVYQGREIVSVIPYKSPEATGKKQFISSDGEVFDAGEVVNGMVERPKVVASRTNFPIDLAYSITIHKSQGMGVDQMHANVNKCFSPGHLYTALSRAESLDGLTLSPFSSFNIHPKVINFYERIRTAA